MESETPQTITRKNILELAYNACWKGINTIREHFNGHGKKSDVIEFAIMSDKAIHALRGSDYGLCEKLGSLTRKSLILFNEYWSARESYQKDSKEYGEALRKEEDSSQHLNRMSKAQTEMNEATKELDILSREIYHFSENELKAELDRAEKYTDQ